MAKSTASTRYDDRITSVSLFDRSTVSSPRPALKTTSRADAVKDGRRSDHATYSTAARPRLDGGEHGVILPIVGACQPRFNGCYDFTVVIAFKSLCDFSHT
jgi:hypothetical protein